MPPKLCQSSYHDIQLPQHNRPGLLLPIRYQAKISAQSPSSNPYRLFYKNLVRIFDVLRAFRTKNKMAYFDPLYRGIAQNWKHNLYC